jgi:pimeloyl-ACP methyl ester carboxylesterase
VTFVLVHGAWHGAWCWGLLVAELERRGSSAIALVLPSDEPDADASRYAELVAAACEAAEGPVTLVGHSLAGLVLPRVAMLRPVASRYVFVGGAIPLPGHSFAEQFGLESIKAEPDMHATQADDLERSYWPDPEQAIAGLYHDCPRELAEWAASKLRPQARAAPREPFAADELPALEGGYVLSREDRMFDPDWMRSAARERLGMEPLELGGGHSPMLSRPAELAELLLRLAA